jgi:hypothetical protein
MLFSTFIEVLLLLITTEIVMPQVRISTTYLPLANLMMARILNCLDYKGPDKRIKFVN